MKQLMTSLYVVTMLLAVVPMIVAVRRRRRGLLPGPLALSVGGVAWWSLAEAVSVAASSLQVKAVANHAMFPGVCLVVLGYAWYVLTVTGRAAWLTPARWVALSVVPTLTALAVATDGLHHQFVRPLLSHPPPGVLGLTPGPGYWVHTTYSYAVVAASIAVLIRGRNRALAGHRTYLTMVSAVTAAPIVANACTVLWTPRGQQAIDLTPIAFLVTVGSWWLLELRGSDTVRAPIAPRQVLQVITDAVMVLDARGAFVELNPAAEALLGTAVQARSPGGAGSALLGLRWHEVLGADVRARLTDAPQQTMYLDDGRVFDVRIEAMSDRTALLGHVVVVRDITEIERLRTELAELALRDPLTGLSNRRHLDEALCRLVASAPSNRISVVMADLDHFKSVNDRFGHAAGDDLLRDVAQQLLGSVRPDDIVARVGGEEFVVLLPGLTARQTGICAEQWRHERSQRAVASATGPVRATISFGWPSGCQATRRPHCCSGPIGRCTGPRTPGATEW